MSLNGALVTLTFEVIVDESVLLSILLPVSGCLYNFIFFFPSSSFSFFLEALIIFFSAMLVFLCSSFCVICYRFLILRFHGCSCILLYICLF